MTTLVEELRAELARAQAEGRELRAKLAIAEGERDGALAQAEELTRALTKADARRSSVDRCSDAWARIARAHRVDPSPANAERIAGLCESAAAVRDEVMAQRDALRAIIEGRTVAPTPREVEVHGGAWLTCSVRNSEHGRGKGHVRHTPATVGKAADYARRGGVYECRWWPLDTDGRPCAWPVVPEATRV